MNGFPTSGLIAILILLIALCAFFSASETGLTMVSRYRLRARAKQGQRGARIAQRLLERPERLLGLILMCSTASNIAAGAVATLIGLRLSGETGVAIATGVLTFLMLIFGEVAPKTLAALHPERVALPAAHVYKPLARLLYPLVWLVMTAAKGILYLFGVSMGDTDRYNIGVEELRAVVGEAGAMIPKRHQRMLLSILDLERATVEDIMVPRNEIFGLDLSEPWDKIRQDIIDAQHTRVPVYDGAIDDLRGIVHLRRLVKPAAENRMDKESLLELVREPYFIPEGTSLNRQLLNFQDQKQRIGFVVDEYGDIQGLVALEDILEEVVGEFTSDPATRLKNIQQDSDGSVLARGSMTLRSLNRALGWKLPTQGPKTLNGLILEQLEELPQRGKRLQIGDYVIEITDSGTNVVNMARIRRAANNKT